MKKSILWIFLATAMTACASSGGEQAGDGGDSVATAESDDQPKQRCYRDKSTGTRLGERICVPTGD